MNPKQQIEIFRKMRDRGEELYAIYHSHPDSPALPSSEDLQQAYYPEALYIIVSMSTAGTLQLKGFRLKNETAVTVDIAVE